MQFPISSVCLQIEGEKKHRFQGTIFGGYSIMAIWQKHPMAVLYDRFKDGPVEIDQRLIDEISASLEGCVYESKAKEALEFLKRHMGKRAYAVIA